MKNIIELLATITDNGTSAFHVAKDKVNSLLGAEGIVFSDGFSVSRSDGSYTDFRTESFDSTSQAVFKMRQHLTLLQQKNILKFEEKTIEQTVQSVKKSIFIITEIDMQELCEIQDISSIQDVVLPVANPIIRVAPNENRFDYSACIIIPKNEGIQSIDQLLQQSSSMQENMQKLLNQYFELDEGKGFELMQNSSDKDYSNDLRVSMDKTDPQVARIRMMLQGMSVYQNPVVNYIEKEVNNEIYFIVKQVDMNRFIEAFNERMKSASLRDQYEQIAKPNLESIIRLMQEYSPENSLLKDLISVDGQNSTGYPYPHIRSQSFHENINVQSQGEIIKFLEILEKEGLLICRLRPQTQAVTKALVPYDATFFKPVTCIQQVVIAISKDDARNEGPKVIDTLRQRINDLIKDKRQEESEMLIENNSSAKSF